MLARNRSVRLAAAAVAAPAAVSLTPPANGQCVEGCLAIHTLTGEAAGDAFGWESNWLPDVDGDGVREFIVSAPTSDAGGTDAGRVYLYSGASGVELWRATGTIAFAQLGWMIGRGGDYDDDGLADVVAGAPWSGSGRAMILSGADGSVIHTFFGEVAGDGFGYRVAGNGDANGDGRADIVVSAFNHDTAGPNAGRVYLYDGTDFSLLCTADGESGSDLFGTSLSFVGDVDDVTGDEFVVGARDAGPSSGGRAYVYGYDGAACDLQHTFLPPAGSVDFGNFFADGGFDVNADGTPDIYVGDFAANRAFVYSGHDFTELHVLSGGGQFGLGEMVDDVNGDGADDLVLAAWLSSAGGGAAGQAFAIDGATGTTLETWTHDVPGANFGFDAAGLGDANGDGRADYVITAASALGGTGRTYVIAGTRGTGDIDGDGVIGITDLIILLGNWGPCGECGECPGDLGGDCSTGILDLVLLLSHWG